MRLDVSSAAIDYCNEILIRDDGSVVIKHLTPELLELALALAPSDERLRRRAALLVGPGSKDPACPTP